MNHSQTTFNPIRDKSPHLIWIFVALSTFGLFLRLFYALRFPNVAFPDEIFQTLEPAHRLAYGYGVISWEWREGVRSWVFPAFLAVVMRATGWLASGSSDYLWGTTVVLTLLSLIAVWFGFAWAKRASGTEAAIIAAGGCAIWYKLVYFAPRALSEVAATNALLPGLYLGVYGTRLPERKRLFLAAALCGLAMALRIQFAPAAIFACVYFCYPNWRQRIPPVLGGLLLPIAFFGLVDAFTWSYPFQSFIQYFWMVGAQGKASTYGTDPWYWYLSVFFVRQMGPVLIAALIGLRRSPFLGWITLLILASHSIVPHKEVRFIYPLIPIVLTLAAIGIVDVLWWFFALRARAIQRKTILAIGLGFFLVTSAIYALHFRAWTTDSGGVIALDHLSHDAAVCGVALYKLPWFLTGGYTHLHKNIPMLVAQTSALEKDTASVNAIVSDGLLKDPEPGLELQACWNGVCLYRRDGGCSAPPHADEINTFLLGVRH
jgi:GPI mannosyltransferase 3